MKDVRIVDITFGPEFFTDYDRSPPFIKKRLDELNRMILDHGKLPSSMHPHNSKGSKSEWIGYVNHTKGSWRLLFAVEGGILILNRLLTHHEADKYFRGL